MSPETAAANFRLGFSLLNLGKYIESREYLEKAFAATPNPNIALALARDLAQLGEKARAYELLEKDSNLAGLAPESLMGAKEFTTWKDEARFKDIVRKLDIAAHPCVSLPESRQFDFWIGDWDVKTPQGQMAGTSSVNLILGQCVIFENWTGIGSAGKSFNFYDTSDKKWHQTWVDDKGTFTHYVGAFQDGKMTIVGKAVIGGKTAMAKITFSQLPNGDVRQFGENSMDDGKTWTPVPGFDLIYTRKK